MSKFQYILKFNSQHRSEISKYCQTQISQQTYYLHLWYGGKDWRITTQPIDQTIQVELQDQTHAIMLSLKY
jgi:hypothetical protein